MKTWMTFKQTAIYGYNPEEEMGTSLAQLSEQKTEEKGRRNG
jgi:hypothetical protein